MGTTATSLPTTLRFGVGTCNIPAAKGQKGDLSRAATKSVAEVVKKHVGLCGFQELSEVEDDIDVEAGLGTGWIHRHNNSENKISARNSRFSPCPKERLPEGWAQSGQEHLHNGLEKVSPERNMTWDIWVFDENPLLDPFLFADLHLVSGVYKGNDHYAWRLEARQQSEAVIKAFLKEAHDAGLNVIWVGDTNWRTMPKMHPLELGFVDGNIDKIRWIPSATANWGLVCINVEPHITLSDHKFMVANVELRINSLYKVPKPQTEADKVEAWLKKYQITSNAEAELRSILTVI